MEYSAIAIAGMVGNELFRYNRKNYEFDKEQWFDREELRLKMQVERFKLFREDIRDLVELTVQKMDLYHLVGAIFLDNAIMLFCKGRIRGDVPPHLLGLYYLTLATSFIYLIVAIWLAMHASVSSHSYGTRLLTRFVRLPIPSSGQMAGLNAKYADFERHTKEMLRIPFVSKPNEWGDGSDARNVQSLLDAASGANAADLLGPRTDRERDADNDLLGQGDPALGREDELLQALDFRTERHVQLFRRLQAKWQCFDAYSRVCMSVGLRQLLQAMTFYLLGVLMVENVAPSVACCLVLVLQTVSVLLQKLDICRSAGWCGNVGIEVVSVLPSIFVLISMILSPILEDQDEDTPPIQVGMARYFILACFPLQVLWGQCVLIISAPTNDDAALPRCWRSVLFMDVFAEGGDPSEAWKGRTRPNSRMASSLDSSGSGQKEDSDASDDERTPLARPDATKAPEGKVRVVPERLPWQLVRTVTRTLQLSWTIVAVLMAMQYFGVIVVDNGHFTRRRLEDSADAFGRGTDSVSELFLEAVPAVWPFGTFFKPGSLCCSLLAGGSLRLLIAGPAGMYEFTTRRDEAHDSSVTGRTATQGSDEGVVSAFDMPFPQFPDGVVPICSDLDSPSATRPPCLLAAWGPRGLEVWSPSRRCLSSLALLRLPDSPSLAEGRHSIRSLGAAVVPCAAVVGRLGLAVDGGFGFTAVDCLLVVVWAIGDTKLSLFVAERPSDLLEPLQPATRLGTQQSDCRCTTGETSTTRASGSAWLIPLAELPLPFAFPPSRSLAANVSRQNPRRRPPSAEPEVMPPQSLARPAALHIEPRSGRLFALTASGELSVWDLFPQPRYIGQWRFNMPPLAFLSEAGGATNFRFTGLCIIGDKLLAGGHDNGGPFGPRLFRAALPFLPAPHSLSELTQK